MAFQDEARFFCGLLRRSGLAPRRVLVVGCGDGQEAGHIARETGARVVGLDLALPPGPRPPGVDLLRADARRLPFRSAQFEAVYCFHVLEHVLPPERAAAEARRVIAAVGCGFFGTPNRSRLVGYLGGRATLWQKVRWNLADYGRRLTGRWSNEQGAHAGFSAGHLARLLGAEFPRVESVSLPYYVDKYPRLERFWRAVFAVGLERLVAPSVYFEARPGANGGALRSEESP